MKKRIKLAVVCFGFWIAANTMPGQALEAAKVRVVVWGEAIADGSFDEGQATATIQFTLPEVPDPPDVISNAMGQTTSPNGGIVTSQMGVNLEPGKLYKINAITSLIAQWNFQAYPPQGYVIELNGVEATSWPGATTIRVVPQGNAFTGRAGESTSLATGRVHWQVSLGSLPNGDPARCLSILDGAGGSSWADLFTPRGIGVQSNEVKLIPNPTTLDPWQVASNEVVVDVAITSTTSYDLKFYNRDVTTAPTVDGDPYTFGTNSPFVVYSISRYGTDTTLKIVRTDNNSAGVAVRTSQTILERTGTSSSDYVWTLSDWHDAGQSVVPVKEVSTWSSNGTGRVETIVKKDDASTVASTVKKQFKAHEWGEEIVSIERGTTDTVKETLTYHVWNSAQDYLVPLAIRSKESTGGNWEAYSYTLGKRGLMARTFRPYNGQPTAPPDIAVVNPASWSTAVGEVVTVAYESGGFRRISSRTTTIDNTQVAKSTTSYTEGTTTKGAAYVVATKDDWNTNTTTVAKARTITKYFREDSAAQMLRNQIWSVQNPDGTKHGFTYQKGDYSGTSFTPSVTGGAVRTSAIKGLAQTTSGATLLTVLALPGEAVPTGTIPQISLAAGELDNVYVVPGKSTLETTIRDERARLRRTETYVWSGGIWNLVSSTDYTYDYANRLISRAASNGATYTATYKTDAGADTAQLQWEQDETGVRTDYTYDKAGRVATATKKGATGVAGDLRTSFAYDADNHVLTQTVSAFPIAGQPTPPTEQMVTGRTYDDAGRLKTETPAGLGTTTYTYNPTNRSQTVTYPSTATRIETYGTDGRLASVTGTALVPEYYTYSIQSGTGYRITTTHFGTATNVRSTETWTDQMGRTVQTSRPGFTGQVDFVATFNFSPTTGQLLSQTKTGYASTLFEYDALGRLKRTGLDIAGTSGLLDLASADRITDTDETYESYQSNWWMTTVQTAYFVTGNGTGQIVARTRKRLNGFSGTSLREEVRSRDAEGEAEGTDVVRVVNYDSGTRTLTTSTTRPGFEFAETATSVAGLAVSSTDHAGIGVTTTYDHLWRPATTVDARAGATTLAYYSGTSLLKTREDATKTTSQSGNITTYAYDTMGRVKTVTGPAGSGYEIRTNYNARGQVLEQWGSGTYPVSYGYDSLGQRETMTTYQTEDVWNGTTWPATPPSGNTTTWVYDPPSGLLQIKKDAALISTSFTYNARGQVYVITSPRLNSSSLQITTTHTYDSNTGELLGKSYNDGTPGLTYTYTRTGQVDAVVQGSGASAVTHDLVYDPTARWRLSTEDWGGFYGGRLFTHTYESASAVSSTGGYGANRLATVRGRSNGFKIGGDSAHPTDLAYDRLETVYFSSLGRVAAVSTRAGTTASRDFVYGYKANSSLLAGYTSGGFELAINYELNRDLISKVSNSWTTSVKSAVADFDYINDSVGRRYGTKQSCNLNPAQGILGAFSDLGGSLFNRYAYNGRGEMISGAAYLIETPIPMTENPAPYASSQLPERNFYYSFDNAGNRLASSRHGTDAPLDSYSPNALNQYSSKQYNTVTVAGTANTGATVSVSGASSAVTVNRRGRYWAGSAMLPNSTTVAKASLSVTSSISGGGSDNATRTATLPRSDQSFTYDPAGNLTDDGLWGYTWDAENRLIGMDTTTGAINKGFPNLKLRFRYDYLGRRIQKRVQNLTAGTDVYRRYLYDGWNLVAEFAATDTTCGSLVRSYSWGLDVVGSFSASGGVGALLQVADHLAGIVGLSARDGNGNVVALINPDPASTSVVAAYEYSPAGEILRADGSMAATNPFRFSSKFTDDETGLLYYGHRYLQPDLGRFINRDPIAEEGGINLYGFAGNNGVSRWDYIGLADPKDEIVKLGAFEVNGGSKPSTFSLGLYLSSNLAFPTGSTLVATLSDNRSFNKQAQEIIDAKRLLENLTRKKGKVSFKTLVVSVLIRVDVDAALDYLEYSLRGRRREWEHREIASDIAGAEFLPLSLRKWALERGSLHYENNRSWWEFLDSDYYQSQLYHLNTSQKEQFNDLVMVIGLLLAEDMLSKGKSRGTLAAAKSGGLRIATNEMGAWARNAPLSSRAAEMQQVLLSEGRVAFGRGQLSLSEIGNIASGLEREVAITRIGQTRYLQLSGTYGGDIALGAGEKFIGHVHPGQGFWGLGRSTVGSDVEAMFGAGIPRQAVLNESGAFRVIRSDGSMSTIFNVPFTW